MHFCFYTNDKLRLCDEFSRNLNLANRYFAPNSVKLSDHRLWHAFCITLRRMGFPEKSALPSAPGKQFFTFKKGVVCMSSAIFTCGNDAYQVSKIIYAGPVTEIPEDRVGTEVPTRSGGFITELKTVFSSIRMRRWPENPAALSRQCLIRSSQRRSSTGSMSLSIRRGLCPSAMSCSSSGPIEQYTHGFVVTVETVAEEEPGNLVPHLFV